MEQRKNSNCSANPQQSWPTEWEATEGTQPASINTCHLLTRSYSVTSYRQPGTGIILDQRDLFEAMTDTKKNEDLQTLSLPPSKLTILAFFEDFI